MNTKSSAKNTDNRLAPVSASIASAAEGDVSIGYEHFEGAPSYVGRIDGSFAGVLNGLALLTFDVAEQFGVTRETVVEVLVCAARGQRD